MTKTMAETLATHRLDVTMYIGTGQEHLCICGVRSDDHDAHQSMELANAGFGDVRDARAGALEDAADDFEDNVGITEFDEQSRRDGRRWGHIEEAWGHQGAYMDWLRVRAAAVRGEG